MELTPTQRAILDYTRERCDLGRPPTFRDIQEHFGYRSVNAVSEPIRKLIELGTLEYGRSKSGVRRGVVPRGFEPGSARRLPVLGAIAAGAPTDSAPVDLGNTWIDPSWVKGPSFALRVKGNSMIEAGIFEEDVLIVERQTEARHGDIIVALWEGETTVKRYEKRQGKVYLVPANSSMEPIAVNQGQLVIQGRVVGLQRRLRR